MGMHVGDELTFEFYSSRYTNVQVIRYPVLYCINKRRVCSEFDTAYDGCNVKQTYVAAMKFEQYLTHDGFEGHYCLLFFRRDKDIWVS